jgi:hypothetical protein
VGFVVDKVAMGQVFSGYFGFPCQFSFHRLLHIHHHPSFGAGTLGQLVADVPSGLSLTTHQKTKKKLKAIKQYYYDVQMKEKEMRRTCRGCKEGGSL